MAKLIPMANKRSLRKTDLEIKEFLKFLSTMQSESERGAVLISGALLDDLLERSIRSLLIDHPLADKLLDKGPLGSAYSRALAAFTLGILSESEYQECERVRSVRNVFGHEVDCSFETPKVKEICSNFDFVLKPGSRKKDTAKQQFIVSATGLLIALARRPSYVSKRRLKYIKP